MTRVLYIMSHIGKALQYEWTAAHIDRQQVDLRFILLQNQPHTPMEAFLKDAGIPCTVIPFTGTRQYPRVLWQLYRQLGSWRPDVVHTHLVDASFLGLLAARLRGIPMRIHTRHHAMEHHLLDSGRAKAVWRDKRINALSTHVVSISDNVRQILTHKEGCPPDKIISIPHGFLFHTLQNPEAAAVAQLRQQLDITDKGPVIGVISRFIALKGIEYTIQAFGQLLAEYPEAVLLLAGGGGDYQAQIDAALATLPAHSWRKTGFIADLGALYALLDIHVHVPVARESESFGQTYVEALATGVPSVFTLSGIAPEFIRHEKNAWVVPYRDAQAIYTGMRTLLADEGLRSRIIAQGKLDANAFELNNMLQRLTQLYTTGQVQAVQTVTHA